MLFRQVGTVVLVVGMGEELQRFFEPDLALQVPPQSLTLAPVEVEPHPESITVIPTPQFPRFQTNDVKVWCRQVANR
jgi:hypothetical protein